MTEVGAVSFRVELDTRNIQAEVSRINQQVRRNAIAIPVRIDSQGVDQQLSALSRQLQQRSTNVLVTIRVDDRSIDQEIVRVARRFAQAPIDVPIAFDSQSVRNQINALEQRLKRQQAVDIPVGVQVDRRGLNQLQQQLGNVRPPQVAVNPQVNQTPINQLNQSLGQTQTQGRAAEGALQGLAAGAAFFALNAALEALQAGIRLVVGTIGEGINQFRQFEASLASFDAKSQGTGVVLDDVANKIKEVAVQTSFTPATLADAATQLVALGVEATDVEGRLATLAKTADVLGEDPVITGRVFQGALEQYERFGVEADDVADILTNLINTTAAGARGGIAEFEQLFSKAAPTAAELGVSIQELSAAFAGLRQTGATAQVSASTLDTVLTRLATRADALTDEGISLSFDETGALSLEGTLINIRERIQGLSSVESIDFLSGIFGESRGDDVLALINSLDGAFGRALDSANNAAEKLNESFEIVSQTLEFQANILEGQVTTALTNLGQAIAPVQLGFVQLASGIIDAASVDLSPLTQSAGQLGTALGQNDDLIDQLGEAFSGLLQSGVDALSRVIDAVTALVSNQDAVDLFVDAIGGFGDAIERAAGVVSFLIAIADGLATVVQAARGIPVVGAALEEAFSGKFLAPIRAVQAAIQELAGLFVRLGQRIAEALGTVPGLGPIFDAAFGKAIQIVTALNDRLVNLRERLFGVREEFEALEGAASDTAGKALEDAASSFAAFNLAVEQTEGAEIEPPSLPARIPLKEQLETLKTDQDKLLADIELRATQATAVLAAQDADEDTIAQRERQTLNERLAARQDFLNELKALLQDEALSAKEREDLEKQVLQTEQAVAQDRVAVQQDLRQQRIKEAEEAAKGVTKALEAERQAQRDAAEEGFRLQGREVQDRNAAAQAEQRKRTEAEIAAFREQSEAKLNAIRKAGEADIQADQEAFQKKQQAQERQFQAQQQAVAQQFQKQLQAQRERGARELSRLETEVERRVQLEEASPFERQELERQFEKEDQAVRERARIEQEVLNERSSIIGDARQDGLLDVSPLEQARKSLENSIQEQQKAFQEQQQALERQFQKEQNQEQLAFEEDLEQRKLELEEKLKDLRLDAEEEIAAIKEEGEKELLALRREQEDAELDRRRQFQAEQRRLDEQSAERIQQILSQARQGVRPQSLRSGGVVQGVIGEQVPTRLHKDEFTFVPSGTRVVSQQESRRLVRQHLERSLGAGAQLQPSALNLPSIPSGATMRSQSAISHAIAASTKQMTSAIDGLSERVLQLASSPRSLSVSSPDPVADMTDILRQFARRQRAIGGSY